MGTDIHIRIERQEQDGQWREVVYQTPWDYPGAKPAVEGIPKAPDGFSGRNYDLFGILADVRNGRGFAGIQMGEGWPSIAANRGFPADAVADDALAPDPIYPEDGPRSLGDHSFTWIALEELRDFPWDLTSTTLYGVVTEEQYAEFLRTKEGPAAYAGGVSGPGIVTYTPKEYEKAKKNGTLAPKPHIRIGWTETAREATYDWPGKVIPWLTELAEGHPLRLVIGFDS